MTHGKHSPVHPSHANAMKYFTSDRVKCVLDDGDLILDGVVIRRHQSEGWYWVRFGERFKGNCLPVRWDMMTRITL